MANPAKQCYFCTSSIQIVGLKVPFKFDFDPVHRVLRCIYTGRLTDDELRQSHADTARYVQRIDPLAAILDLSGVTVMQLSPSTVQQLASDAAPIPDPSRPRVIIAPSNLLYGMSRMYQIVAEAARPKLYVVRTMREALTEIGVEDPQFQEMPEG